MLIKMNENIVNLSKQWEEMKESNLKRERGRELQLFNNDDNNNKNSHQIKIDNTYQNNNRNETIIQDHHVKVNQSTIFTQLQIENEQLKSELLEIKAILHQMCSKKDEPVETNRTTWSGG